MELTKGHPAKRCDWQRQGRGSCANSLTDGNAWPVRLCSNEAYAEKDQQEATKAREAYLVEAKIPSSTIAPPHWPPHQKPSAQKQICSVLFMPFGIVDQAGLHHAIGRKQQIVLPNLTAVTLLKEQLQRHIHKTAPPCIRTMAR